MPWLDDLVAHYVAQGLGTFGTDLFAGSMAIIPKLEGSGALTELLETGGATPEFIQNFTTKPAYTNDSAMVMVRGADIVAARARAASYYGVSTRANVTINGIFYQRLRPVGGMLDQKPDERGNARVSFNILGKRRA